VLSQHNLTNVLNMLCTYPTCSPLTISRRPHCPTVSTATLNCYIELAAKATRREAGWQGLARCCNPPRPSPTCIHATPVTDKSSYGLWSPHTARMRASSPPAHLPSHELTRLTQLGGSPYHPTHEKRPGLLSRSWAAIGRQPAPPTHAKHPGPLYREWRTNLLFLCTPGMPPTQHASHQVHRAKLMLQTGTSQGPAPVSHQGAAVTSS
jgi:hypothetical protein